MRRFIGGPLNEQHIDCGDEHRFVSHGQTAIYQVANVDNERIMRLVTVIKHDLVGIGRRGKRKY